MSKCFDNRPFCPDNESFFKCLDNCPFWMVNGSFIDSITKQKNGRLTGTFRYPSDGKRDLNVLKIQYTWNLIQYQ